MCSDKPEPCDNVESLKSHIPNSAGDLKKPFSPTSCLSSLHAWPQFQKPVQCHTSPGESVRFHDKNLHLHFHLYSAGRETGKGDQKNRQLYMRTQSPENWGPYASIDQRAERHDVSESGDGIPVDTTLALSRQARDIERLRSECGPRSTRSQGKRGRISPTIKVQKPPANGQFHDASGTWQVCRDCSMQQRARSNRAEQNQATRRESSSQRQQRTNYLQNSNNSNQDCHKHILRINGENSKSAKTNSAENRNHRKVVNKQVCNYKLPSKERLGTVKNGCQVSRKHILREEFRDPRWAGLLGSTQANVLSSIGKPIKGYSKCRCRTVARHDPGSSCKSHISSCKPHIRWPLSGRIQDFKGNVGLKQHSNEDYYKYLSSVRNEALKNLRTETRKECLTSLRNEYIKCITDEYKKKGISNFNNHRLCKTQKKSYSRLRSHSFLHFNDKASGLKDKVFAPETDGNPTKFTMYLISSRLNVKPSVLLSSNNMRLKDVLKKHAQNMILDRITSNTKPMSPKEIHHRLLNPPIRPKRPEQIENTNDTNQNSIIDKHSSNAGIQPDSLEMTPSSLNQVQTTADIAISSENKLSQQKTVDRQKVRKERNFLSAPHTTKSTPSISTKPLVQRTASEQLINKVKIASAPSQMRRKSLQNYKRSNIAKGCSPPAYLEATKHNNSQVKLSTPDTQKSVLLSRSLSSRKTKPTSPSQNTPNLLGSTISPKKYVSSKHLSLELAGIFNHSNKCRKQLYSKNDQDKLECHAPTSNHCFTGLRNKAANVCAFNSSKCPNRLQQSVDPTVKLYQQTRRNSDRKFSPDTSGYKFCTKCNSRQQHHGNMIKDSLLAQNKGGATCKSKSTKILSQSELRPFTSQLKYYRSNTRQNSTVEDTNLNSLHTCDRRSSTKPRGADCSVQHSCIKEGDRSKDSSPHRGAVAIKLRTSSQDGVISHEDAVTNLPRAHKSKQHQHGMNTVESSKSSITTKFKGHKLKQCQNCLNVCESTTALVRSNDRHKVCREMQLHSNRNDVKTTNSLCHHEGNNVSSKPRIHKSKQCQMRLNEADYTQNLQHCKNRNPTKQRIHRSKQRQGGSNECLGCLTSAASQSTNSRRHRSKQYQGDLIESRSKTVSPCVGGNTTRHHKFKMQSPKLHQSGKSKSKGSMTALHHDADTISKPSTTRTALQRQGSVKKSENSKKLSCTDENTQPIKHANVQKPRQGQSGTMEKTITKPLCKRSGLPKLSQRTQDSCKELDCDSRIEPLPLKTDRSALVKNIKRVEKLMDAKKHVRSSRSKSSQRDKIGKQKLYRDEQRMVDLQTEESSMGGKLVDISVETFEKLRQPPWKRYLFVPSETGPDQLVPILKHKSPTKKKLAFSIDHPQQAKSSKSVPSSEIAVSHIQRSYSNAMFPISEQRHSDLCKDQNHNLGNIEDIDCVCKSIESVTHWDHERSVLEHQGSSDTEKRTRSRKSSSRRRHTKHEDVTSNIPQFCVEPSPSQIEMAPLDKNTVEDCKNIYSAIDPGLDLPDIADVYREELVKIRSKQKAVEKSWEQAESQRQLAEEILREKDKEIALLKSGSVSPSKSVSESYYNSRTHDTHYETNVPSTSVSDFQYPYADTTTKSPESNTSFNKNVLKCGIGNIDLDAAVAARNTAAELCSLASDKQDQHGQCNNSLQMAKSVDQMKTVQPEHLQGVCKPAYTECSVTVAYPTYPLPTPPHWTYDGNIYNGTYPYTFNVPMPYVRPVPQSIRPQWSYDCIGQQWQYVAQRGSFPMRLIPPQHQQRRRASSRANEFRMPKPNHLVGSQSEIRPSQPVQASSPGGSNTSFSTYGQVIRKNSLPEIVQQLQSQKETTVCQENKFEIKNKTDCGIFKNTAMCRHNGDAEIKAKLAGAASIALVNQRMNEKLKNVSVSDIQPDSYDNSMNLKCSVSVASEAADYSDEFEDLSSISTSDNSNERTHQTATGSSAEPIVFTGQSLPQDTAALVEVTTIEETSFDAVKGRCTETLAPVVTVDGTRNNRSNAVERTDHVFLR